MNIVLTGSISNIGKPLTQALVQKGHSVTVISNKLERQKDIEALGANAAIGAMQDTDFLIKTFKGADIVYLMETLDAAGSMFDKNVDFIETINTIGNNYKQAVEQSNIKCVVHLSSVGAHMNKDNGILIFHHNVENILKELPADVSIKTMRPVGFYTNIMSLIRTIKSQGVIVFNYGGNTKEPWVSPSDIAAVIAEEIDKPFEGRTVRYIASDEASPNEIAKALGNAIGKPDLKWLVIPDEELLNNWLKAGMNEQIAKGFVEMQSSQGNGVLYENYNRHKPVLGKVKITDFAKQFATAYNQE